jgi:ATP-dependent Clp protease ATP-binding subunit ClpC
MRFMSAHLLGRLRYPELATRLSRFPQRPLSQQDGETRRVRTLSLALKTALGLVILLVALCLLAWLVHELGRWIRRNPSPRKMRSSAASWWRRVQAGTPPSAPAGPAGEEPGVHGREAAAARALADLFAREQRPVNGLALLDEPRVAAVVAGLAQPSVPVSESWDLARSRQNLFEIAFGLAALRARDDPPPELTDWAFRALRNVHSSIEPFVYAVLLEHAQGPVIGRALATLDVELDREELTSFIGARRAAEDVTAETFSEHVPLSLVESVAAYIADYETQLGAGFREIFESWRNSAVDTDFLRNIGTLWAAPYDRPEALLVGDRRELIELMCEALEHEPPRSLLIVGDHGVGKTALLRAALDRAGRKPIVFEASASRINAGASYVGQLDGRAQDLVRRLRRRNVIWVMPQLHEALYAGQHSQSPQGLLDALLPHIENGDMCMAGEVGSAEFEQLVAARPRVASAFDVVRVRALGESESVEVVRHALAAEERGATASQDTLVEAHELAQQFLPGIGAPGNTLRLVSAASAEVIEEGRHEITSADVLTTLAATSGLPLAMLDPTIRLPLADVRAFFEERVLGQGEAVNGVVERIAIARAGLNDPTRPLGVLLLVGPTGTGKTELAKTLAEFMFGSPNRLVRVDMSEYQTGNSLERLLADTNVDRDGASLIAAVRKDPFSVVLLDEFEKAAPPIWDLFLQVFDDGRLTDIHGRAADFRRCVFLLTSNIGSAIASGNPVGFDRTKEGFRADRIEEAVSASFRPEFLNRIDRVIVFRPFDRQQMHALLQKELRDVLARRGFRAQPWAIELDESASEFIIEQGFSPELGARPLKRAVERHLLAPLAEVIVEQTAPRGDLFLFISRNPDAGITVSFVNLESGEDSQLLTVEQLDAAGRVAPLDLRGLALAGRADAQQVRLLLAELETVSEVVHGELQERKQRALTAMGREGFWEGDARFATLAEIEYIERSQTATMTAQRLGARLSAQAGDEVAAGTGNVVSLLALRLLVLHAALRGLEQGAPSEVYLRIRLAADDESAAGGEWAEQLARMYEAWALARGMNMERIGEGRLYCVSGLGAGEILLPESGLHVLELISQSEHGGRLVERASCVVEVVGRDPRHGAERSELAGAANGALRSAALVPSVVRRYRPAPTPLVRDAVRGYRTGRLDRVLAGDFDLFGEEAAAAAAG